MTAEKDIHAEIEKIRNRYAALPGKAEKRWINERVEKIMKAEFGIVIDKQDRELWISNRRGLANVRDVEFAHAYATAFVERLQMQRVVFNAVAQLAEA